MPGVGLDLNPCFGLYVDQNRTVGDQDKFACLETRPGFKICMEARAFTMKKNMDSEARHRPQRRRWKKRYVLLGIALVGCFLVAVGIPFAASQRSWVLYGVNHYGGLAPLRVDLDSVAVRWFSPIEVRGLRVIDGQGATLASIGSVQTSNGLFALATNQSDLGTISLHDASIDIEVQPGSSNLEQALSPWMNQPSKSSSSAAIPRGKISLENCSVTLRDTIELRAWKCQVEKGEIPFPTADQPIPAANVVGKLFELADANTAANDQSAKFAVKVLPQTEAVPVNASQGSQSPLRLQAILQNMPLAVWGLAKRRFPDLPVDRLQGLASLQADLTFLDASHWIAKVESAQVSNFLVAAPLLIGAEGASLEQTQVQGLISMDQNQISIQQANMMCDVGACQGNASVGLPLVLPSATQPWLDHANFALEGSVDLAKLVRSAPGLIKMKDDTQLVAGQAQVTAKQEMAAGQLPNASYHLQLGNLKAQVNGAPIEWKQAMTADVTISPNDQGQARMTAECLAEFCNLHADGDLQQGKMQSDIDLDKLQQRLSSWFELPVNQMAGKAQCTLDWRKDEGERLQVTGTLVTTPVRIGLPSGDLLEPAWNGKCDLIARLPQGSLTQIDRASATLTSANESLQLELMEPISMLDEPTGIQPLPPAGLHVKLVGDLASWQRRGQMFAGLDLGIGLGGRCDVVVKGAADKQHLEVLSAQWNAKAFSVKGNGFALNEPEMQGEFKGRFDSRELANLVVDQLTVQAISFALTAKDSAIPATAGRQGMAAFRIDPTRMMSAIDTGGDPNAAATSVQGDVTGRAQWKLEQGSITWQVDVDAKNLNVVSVPPRSPGTLASNNANQTTSLWSEPEAKAIFQGVYQLADGSLTLPLTQLQTNWLGYSGQTQLNSTATQTAVNAEGQMNYDAGRIIERLRPMLGNYVNMQGQRTEPVKVAWISGEGNHWANGLQATTRLGWDSANVIGIDIGQGLIPVTIENGHLKSKTEIPVSQGTLRWDIDGDLESMEIHQSPMVVLDHVAITPMMCQGWLQYVAPILANATSVQGQLSLKVDEAKIVPSDLTKQKVRGELQLHSATVGPGPLADQLMGIVQQIRTLRKGATAATATAQNTWLQLPEQKIDFAVDSGRIIHKNLQIAAGDVTIQTSGEVAIDGTIQMMAQVPIPQEWIASTPALASLAGQSLQLPITGTIQRPQVDYRSLGQLTTQMATGAAQGYLQKQLDKGFNKLLGPMQQQIQNLQQGLPLPQGK